MTRRTKITVILIVGLLAVGAVAAFAGPVLYRDFLAPKAAERPALVATPTEDASGSDDALDDADFTGTWNIDDGSEAGYRVDEVLNGTDVTVTGRTADLSGNVIVDGLTAAEASIEVDVASIATDNGSRDSYFRNQAMRSSEFPTATFTLTEAAEAENTRTSGAPLEHELVGELTLAGVAQPVTFPVQWQTDGDTARVVGSIAITFADYGIEAPSLGFVRVEPDGYVEFDLTLSRE